MIVFGMFAGDEFLYMARGYRVVNIRGRYGSGKTLLAVALGVEFWKRRWCENIVSNVRLYDEWYYEVGSEIRDSVVIYDEAWQTLDARAFGAKESQRWLAYLRKRNITLLTPSVISVDVRFRVITVQRLFELGAIWSYRWAVDDGIGKLGGVFYLVRPLVYGRIYNHLQEPDYDMGEKIANALSGKLGGVKDRELVMDVPEFAFPELVKERKKK